MHPHHYQGARRSLRKKNALKVFATRNIIDLFLIIVLEFISTLINRTHVSVPSKPVFFADFGWKLFPSS